MTLLQSIILGIVQGITEFFPVSSSAHLRMAKWFLGVSDGEHLLHFDLVCHSGTLLALILFLRKDIWATLFDRKAVALFALALFPLVPAYFLLKPLRVAASDPAYLGYFLIFTALILFASSKKLVAKDQKESVKEGVYKVKDVLWIGIMQTMALLPGISRSGSTIAMGRFLGWDWVAAARFSFLLAIPAIVGGQAIETLKFLRGPLEAGESIAISCYAAGFLTSFAIGNVGVRFIFRIYEKGNVRPFAWYCLGTGLFALWALHG